MNATGPMAVIGTVLDVAATLALAVSVGLLVILFAGLLAPQPDTAVPDPHYLSALASTGLLLGLLTLPTLWSAIAWPLHLRQKRRGKPVFGWLRLVVLASAVWMGLVFEAIGRL